MRQKIAKLMPRRMHLRIQSGTLLVSKPMVGLTGLEDKHSKSYEAWLWTSIACSARHY